MKPPATRPNHTLDAYAYNGLARRMSFEVAWAAIFPPLIATLVALLADALRRNAVREDLAPAEVGILVPLMVGGMAVLSAVIFMDRRAAETFRSRADQIRTTQGISTAITMIFLTVAVTAQSDRGRDSDITALVLFLCLPVLFVCAGFLWHAATLIRSSFHRGLMLLGFVIVTALVALLSAREVHRNAEERLFMLNSLLVALAFAIHLSVWSTRALSPVEKAKA